MIEEMIFLASYGTGSFDNIINQLEQAGAFTYILPFLFIFALIFGILTRTKIFENNKGINFILSLVVALMALQTNYVSNFFSIISPLLGVGLVVLLVAVIFLGLIAPKETWIIYTIFGISAIILINILVNVAKETGSGWYTWWTQWSGLIILITVIIVIWLIFSSDKPAEGTYGKIVPKLLKGLAGD
jgi:hypothetical protein